MGGPCSAWHPLQCLWVPFGRPAAPLVASQPGEMAGVALSHAQSSAPLLIELLEVAAGLVLKFNKLPLD